MKPRQTARFIFILSLSPVIPAYATESLRSEITVRVYNFAGTPARDLACARQAASEIFARSEIDLNWLNCTLDADGQPADPACHTARGPAVLNLRLAPRNMEPKSGLARGIFGFSLIGEHGEFSSTASIYLQRASEIVDGRKYRLGPVLGAMIAHELGHLLLGMGSHSKVGIMSLPWGPEQLIAADNGTLGFSGRETYLLAAAVRARRAQSVVGPDIQSLRCMAPTADSESI